MTDNKKNTQNPFEILKEFEEKYRKPLQIEEEINYVWKPTEEAIKSEQLNCNYNQDSQSPL